MNRKIILRITLALMIIVLGAGLAQAAQPQAVDDLGTRMLPWFESYVEKGSDTYLGGHASMAVRYNGVKYIAYYDSTNKDLRFAKYVGTGGNCGTANRWSCETVDSTGDVGQYASLAMASPSMFLGGTRYGISYYDATNHALKYAYYFCTNSIPVNCSWKIETIQSSSIAMTYYGTYTDLAYNEDNSPIIGYRNSTVQLTFPSKTMGTLRYAYRKTGGNCGVGDAAGDWECETIDYGEGFGQYLSMDLDTNGMPRFTYYDSKTDALRYARYQGIFSSGCTNQTDGGWTCYVLDQSGGKYSSYSFQDDSPNDEEVAYYDSASGQLRYAIYVGYGSSTANCGWDADDAQYIWHCYDMAEMGAGLTYADVSLTLDGDNNPLIAYTNATDDQGPATIDIARPNSAIGLLVGNCGPSGGLFDTWTCESIGFGGAYLSEGSFISAATNPVNGLVSIAYDEDDSYYLESHLKIVEQLYAIYLPITMKK